MNAMADVSVPRSFNGGGSTGRDLDRAPFVAEPVCDNGFSDAVDDFVVIEPRVSEPLARLIKGDDCACPAVGEEDQNDVQSSIIHGMKYAQAGLWLRPSRRREPWRAARKLSRADFGGLLMPKDLYSCNFDNSPFE
jgi:hypothetical protein